jgi:hypothetical protein
MGESLTISRESGALQACLTEYVALRSVFEGLTLHVTQYQNFAVALIVAVGTVGALGHGEPAIMVSLGLVAPIPFSLLGYFCFRASEEVYYVASYLDEHLRPLVAQLTDEPRVWHWEAYKARMIRRVAEEEKTRSNAPRTVLFLKSTTLFLLPSVVVLGVGEWSLMASESPNWWKVLGSVLFAEILLLVYSIGRHIWCKGDLPARFFTSPETRLVSSD